MPNSIDALLTSLVKQGGSDLHLRFGMHPMARIHGSLEPQREFPILDEQTLANLMLSVISDKQRDEYDEIRTLDTSYRVPGVARFRLNYFYQQGYMGAVFRQIPEDIPLLTDLGAPQPILDFSRQPRGLVLVTGPTGSGKSTTLAAVINVINHEREDHILTIEDPIEFVHTPARCVINQREIGTDSPNFPLALRAALRQDPDVILVGEMRDLETIETAITAAETGHLVFGTLHTSSAPSSISRLVDVFPEGQQQQVLTMLSSSLVGIVTQTLLPRADGKGRVAAFEVLAMTQAIRANIRQNKIDAVASFMSTSGREGCQPLDKHLADLVFRGQITEETAREKLRDEKAFEQTLAALKQGREVFILPLANTSIRGVEMGDASPTAAPVARPAQNSAPPQAAAALPDMGEAFGEFDMSDFDMGDEPPEVGI